MNRIAIVGQGYVGLPLSLLFAEAGATVFALDTDPTKIAALKEGRSYIRHIDAKRIASAVETGNLCPSLDFEEIAQVNASLICVPTPLDEHRQPDMSYVRQTALSIGPHIQPGTLVVLESTSYPGTTEELLGPILEAQSGLKAGTDFHLAFSPEREDPANPASNVKQTPKLVGGVTATCRRKACELYATTINTLIPVSSCKVAEAAKLTENIFRSVNIALVNELKVIFEKMGIDVWQVLDASKTKPFGYMPFYPGPGLGGHCIPIDPFYLSWKAKEFGISTRFIELAGEINQVMPEYVVNRLAEALNEAGRPIKGSRVLIVGVAYKKNVDDMRESPALRILELITNRGGRAAYHDPFIPVIPKTREFAHWEGEPSIKWTSNALRAFDAAIIVTDHDDMDYHPLLAEIPTIVDTRNALVDLPAKERQIWKA